MPNEWGKDAVSLRILLGGEGHDNPLSTDEILGKELWQRDKPAID